MLRFLVWSVIFCSSSALAQSEATLPVVAERTEASTVSSTRPTETPLLTEVAAASSRRARRAACRLLTEALGESDSVTSLRSALDRAADRLGPASRQGVELRRLSARRDLSLNRLERAVERRAADLRFEPVREADLPEGFPPTTPVGEIFVKRYPRYRMAQAQMGRGGVGGPFFKLFNHIQRNDIPMTAPVQMDYSAGNRREQAMAFLYEGPDKGQPGEDRRSRGQVQVVDVAPLMTVAIGLRGYDSPRSVAEARRQLEAWLAARDWIHAAGPMRRLGYNSPMVVGERRYYEVEIPVRIEL